MKTHLELLIEARRVESLGRLYADEHRRSMADGSASDFFAPRILVKFPESHFTGVDGVRTRERWIEVAMTADALPASKGGRPVSMWKSVAPRL